MFRITVSENYDGHVVGWFDVDTAQKIERNNSTEVLYYTKKRTWILYRRNNRYTKITTQTAFNYLLEHELEINDVDFDKGVVNEYKIFLAEKEL